MAEAKKVVASFNKYFPDGLVQFEEFFVLFKHLSASIPDTRLRDIWDEQPKEDDGRVKVFTLLSYLDVCDASGLRQLTSALATDEGRTKLKSLFDSLDKDVNGRVSSKEWGKAVSSNKDILAEFFGGSSTKEIGQAFAWIDADGSKDLSWQEFIDAGTEFELAIQISDAMATDEGRAELKALFDTLDKDANGKLSSKEWGKGVSKNKEVMAKFFGGSKAEQVGRAFNRIDTDGDKQLSWEEFVEAVGKFR